MSETEILLGAHTSLNGPAATYSVMPHTAKVYFDFINETEGASTGARLSFCRRMMVPTLPPLERHDVWRLALDRLKHESTHRLQWAISLGQAAIVLLGAYLTTISRQQLGAPLPLALLLSGVVTGIIGALLIGQPAVRLRGPYLGIATFALAVALPQVLKMKPITPWTLGVRGIHSSPLLLPLGNSDLLSAEQWRFYVALLATLPMVFAFHNLMRSRYGRALLALREDELVASQMGISIRHYKTLAFGLSAFYAGVGGGLFFLVQGYVSPDSLRVFDSILFLIAIVIGGLGSLAGSIYGAIFLTFQNEVISTLTRLIPNAQHSGSVLIGVLLIAATLLFPRGIAGFVDAIRRQQC